jgi:hypothetical protein
MRQQHELAARTKFKGPKKSFDLVEGIYLLDLSVWWNLFFFLSWSCCCFLDLQDHSHTYPVLSSLAKDYLASSAFSASVMPRASTF